MCGKLQSVSEGKTMRKSYGTFLILAGIVLVLYVLTNVFVYQRLFAEGCTQDCASDNHACYGDSYGVVCTCNSIVHGRTWSNTPTYGSTTGDVTVSFEDKTCYLAHICYVLLGPNSKCVKESGAYVCKQHLGSECTTFSTVVTETHPYRNCRSWFCLEE